MNKKFVYTKTMYIGVLSSSSYAHVSSTPAGGV